MINEGDLRLFGETLKKARLLLSVYLTNTQLGEKIGVASTTITSWHEYRTFPKKELLPKIAEAYGIKYEEMCIAWETSTNARRNEVKNRRNKKTKSVRGLDESRVSKDLISAADNSPKLLFTRSSRSTVYYKRNY